MVFFYTLTLIRTKAVAGVVGFDSDQEKIPTKVSIFSWWTYGESNSTLIHAMDAYYHYTIGPNLDLCVRIVTQHIGKSQFYLSKLVGFELGSFCCCVCWSNCLQLSTSRLKAGIIPIIFNAHPSTTRAMTNPIT